MENLNERILQTAAECVDFLKDMEISNDPTSRNLFERKMKQYENQFYEYELKMKNQSRNAKKQPQNFPTINENLPNEAFQDPFSRRNKFFDGIDNKNHYQNVTYRPNLSPIEPKLFDSLKGVGDIRANAKTYGDNRDRAPFFGSSENMYLNNRASTPEKLPQNFVPHNQNPILHQNPNYNNFPNEIYIKPIYPKVFLENYLAVSKSLTNKAPQDYRFVLARNIQNLGGIEDTIAKMEESLRQYELKNVYSYCELDDPKYQNYFMNSYSPSMQNFRRDFNEIDLNQRLADTGNNFNYAAAGFYEDKSRRGYSHEKYI